MIKENKLLTSCIDFSQLLNLVATDVNIVKPTNPQTKEPGEQHNAISIGDLLINSGHYEIQNWDDIRTIRFNTPFRQNTVPSFYLTKSQINPYFNLTPKLEHEYINPADLNLPMFLRHKSHLNGVFNVHFFDQWIDRRGWQNTNYQPLSPEYVRDMVYTYNFYSNTMHSNTSTAYNVTNETMRIMVDHVPLLMAIAESTLLDIRENREGIENGNPWGTLTQEEVIRRHLGNALYGKLDYIAIGLK